jgi:hypothetical protein
MTTDHRVTPGLIYDIVNALERHGYYRSDDLHADCAIGLIGDLACIYEGTQDHPAYPGSARYDTITITHADAITIFAASDIAADDKPYRAEMCPDCPDQSCPRLPDPHPGCRGLRPDGRSHAPGRPSRPRRQQAHAGSLVPARRRQGGRPVTPSRRNPDEPAHRPAAATPLIPGSRAGERDMAETAEPYDLPFPDQWPHRPTYVIVVDQLRDWRPGQPPSLAELLEAGPARTREPEPDLEAEP